MNSKTPSENSKTNSEESKTKETKETNKPNKVLISKNPKLRIDTEGFTYIEDLLEITNNNPEAGITRNKLVIRTMKQKIELANYLLAITTGRDTLGVFELQNLMKMVKTSRTILANLSSIAKLNNWEI